MKALVIFSGGQDSTTCLGWALWQYGADNVHAVGFNYGQTHVVELQQAARIAAMYDVPYRVFTMDVFAQLGDSSLVTGLTTPGAVHARNKDLPASWVPNRNAMFITIAHAYAQKIGCGRLVTGVSQADYSGYPDCRESFLTRIESALNSGADEDIHIDAPLLRLDKCATFELAQKVGFLDTVLEHSHTCYNGNREQRHSWGYGCGECPSCALRAKGWMQFMRYAD